MSLTIEELLPKLGRGRPTSGQIAVYRLGVEDFCRRITYIRSKTGFRGRLARLVLSPRRPRPEQGRLRRRGKVDHRLPEVRRSAARHLCRRVSANSYAKRVAGYLLAFGMPSEGGLDRRPSMAGMAWTREEIARLKAAVLWMVLHQHVPGKPGQRVEDIVAGKSLLAMLRGDKQRVLTETLRELNGDPFSGENFTMTVGELDDCHLDPAAAVTVTHNDLFALAGQPLEKDGKLGNEPIYVPRVPHDATEARAMLAMVTLFADVTDPAAFVNSEAAFRTFAGYTDDELRRGNPAVRVR
jgi:hypothetical protein